MRPTLLLVLAALSLAVAAESAVARPLILPTATVRPGGTAWLEVVAPAQARSCRLTLGRGLRHRQSFPISLGGPTRLVRWRVPRTGRGSWRAGFACAGADRRSLGSMKAIVTIGHGGRPRGLLVTPRSLRVGHGSIPEMPRPRTLAHVGASNDVNTGDTRPGFQFSGCDSRWMSRTRTVGDGVATELQLEPTLLAREHAGRVLSNSTLLLLSSFESYPVYREMWADLSRCTRIPSSLSPDELHSLYMQMACHARYGVVPTFGGNTWDFEAWRPNVDWSVAMAPWNRCQSGAWGIDRADEPPISSYVDGLNGRLVHSTADLQDPPQTWLVAGRTTRLVGPRAYDCLVRAGKSPAVVYPGGFFEDYMTDGLPVTGLEACGAPLPPPPTLPGDGGPPPPGPAPGPAPARYAVYGTCADGACGLHKRSGPGYTAYAIVGNLADGDAVDIVCQATGELVTPNHGTASNVWDRLADGAYVTDVYITTPAVGGAFTDGIPRC